jgi:hypothetical protein
MGGHAGGMSRRRFVATAGALVSGRPRLRGETA